jgi:uncharacterized protein (TIGR00730 family)
VSPAVAVFGSSEALPGEPLYEQAQRVGGLLARGGATVLTGGYGGVMEAASRGAREAGGAAVGVVCDGWTERGRVPNAYLSACVGTADLHERTRELVDRADAYLVLPGKSGTLAELTLLWALHRAGALGDRPIVLLGTVWTPLLQHLVAWNMLEPAQLRATRVVETPEEAAALLGTR